MVTVSCQLQQQFLREPSDSQTVVGSTNIFYCKVDNLQSRVQWTRNGFGLGTGRKLPGYPRYTIIGAEELGRSIPQIFVLFQHWCIHYRLKNLVDWYLKYLSYFSVDIYIIGRGTYIPQIYVLLQCWYIHYRLKNLVDWYLKYLSYFSVDIYIIGKGTYIPQIYTSNICLTSVLIYTLQTEELGRSIAQIYILLQYLYIHYRQRNLVGQ